MKIKNKEYPYPVLEEVDDSYKKSIFTTKIDVNQEGYNIILNLSANTNNKELLELIKKGKAIYTHHIECSKTCYRTAILTKESLYKFEINDKEISGKIQICSFITANEDIKRYSSSDFSDDYRGFNFDIDKGCIMAVGNQVDLDVDKERDELAKTSSIFSVIKVKDPKSKYMSVDMSDEKILILLSEEAFSAHKKVNPNLLHSIIIIPALVYVIEQLKYTDIMEQYKESRWFRSLAKVGEKMNCPFDEKNIESINSLERAQQFLDDPLLRSLKFIADEPEEV